MLIKHFSKTMHALVAAKIHVSFFAMLLTLSVINGAHAIPLQEPLFLSTSAKPHISLVMSVDNELFKKAYNDYSNLDGNQLTIADTTYRNNFKYYGYFDSDWCYSYVSTTGAESTNYFTPQAAASSHKCTAASGYWSGNFLNWATMARVDILRRVLYGGKRSVDTNTQTILERSHLPRDTHAFVKVYNGSDMNTLTPYTYNSTSLPAISMCNVSTGVAGHPIVKVAKGAWRQWSAGESTQCEYGTANTAPASTEELSKPTVKVNACVAGKDADTSVRCKKYKDSNHKKPFGLLQTYGENGSIKFSLVTGSYKANLKGGVLRREASLIAGNKTASLDEVNLSTGVFNNVSGIISNINSFKIATYNFANNYTDCNTHSITIATVKAGNDSRYRCSDWGNPLSEIYLEALRYIAGNKSPSTGFNVNDAVAGAAATYDANFPGLAGLTNSLWGAGMADPWPSSEWCAKCFSIVISTGANSFDGDHLDSSSDLPGLSTTALNTLTNSIGTQEYPNFTTTNIFSGGTVDGERYCKAGTLSGGLSSFRGVCPEQPATEGSYHIAGLAYYARTTDLRQTSAHTGMQNLTTYAIDLAESLPSFKVPVGANTVEFLPACEARSGSNPWQTCSLIDVKVESLTYSGGNLVAGSYLFYWEDSLWGFDNDFDGGQRISFCVGTACGSGVTASQIKIVNSVPYANAGNSLRFSYNIVGVGGFVDTNVISNQSAGTPTVTADDTANFVGGILIPWASRPGGQNFNTLKATPDNIPSTVTRVESVFTTNTSTAVLLKKPLYYVAKYGGFNDSNENGIPDLVTEWDNKGGVQDGVPDNYFSVKNPADLEQSLKAIFSSILSGLATASAVATNSTRLQENTYLYQAQFDSQKWNGALFAYEFDKDGKLEDAPAHCTKTTKKSDGSISCAGVMPVSSSGRNIYTYNGTNTVSFVWGNLTTTQRSLLRTPEEGTSNTNAQARVNWLRGDSTNEGALLRDRGQGDARNILGDIVNSSPAYVGTTDFRYERLPNGGLTYTAFVNSKKAKFGTDGGLVLIGANDGMVHAFNANNLTERFAYVPGIAFPKLLKLSRPDYAQKGSDNPHQFIVDGPITIGDVYINNQWRTIAVGTLGAGGRGIYALDITDSTPASPNFKVLFELNESNYSQLGYVMGRPLIVPMKNGRFAVVFGNGDSSGATSSLFVVDIESPLSSHTKVIDTGAGTGLSAPALLPNGKGEIEWAYAGDISGNLWRFRLDDADTSKWSSGLLFEAKDEDGNVQPITAAPTLGINPFKQRTVTPEAVTKTEAIMVYVGTGKYYDTGDNDTDGVPVQSFYAIVDTWAKVSKSSLYEKTVTTTESPRSRTVSEPDLKTFVERQAWWDSHSGWYLDFDANGEQVTTKPLLIQDRLIFPTLIPTDSACEYGGRSWLMDVSAVGSKIATAANGDTDGDGDVDENDGDGSGGSGGSGGNNNGGVLGGGNVFNDALILGDLGFGLRPKPGEAAVLGPLSSGKTLEEDAKIDPSEDGRQSWRQVR